MSARVAIVDYQMGNICSVTKALEQVGAEYVLTSDIQEIEAATHLILPGVGHFEKGMAELRQRNLVDPLRKLAERKPLLGICLGMQLLFLRSEEAPGVDGLGIIDGELERFRIELAVPHVGWNEAYGDVPPKIFEGIESHSNFYFVHSYFVKLREDIPHMKTDYEIEFVSAVEKGSVWGVQFHPEKSQKKGLALLKNFLKQEGQC